MTAPVASPPQPLVLVSVDRGVASLVLNRPERQNAWTPGMARQYFAALNAAARDPDVRAIVVSGAGGAFCAGGDAAVLEEMAAEGDDAPQADPSGYLLGLTLAKPTIAAVAGPCFGVGLQQALCCDVRFAAEDAKFSTAFVRRGLVAEMGVSWLLPRVVGLGHAADLLLSARVVRADEAQRMGLVNRVVPAAQVLEEALAYGRLLAEKCAPRAMRAIKGQLYRDVADDLETARQRAEALLHQSLEWPDFAEGVSSWRENRAPAFPSLPADLALLETD